MDGELLSAREAAKLLGINVTTLYDWLGQADHGLLTIRGQRIDVRYFQTGPAGQGRIRFELEEVERLRELMTVPAQHLPQRTASQRRQVYPGIHVPLGLPNRG